MAWRSFEISLVTRAAARTAVALAQTTAQLVRNGTTVDALAGVARHAVEGTRALACGMVVAGEDHRLVAAGSYGLTSPPIGREARSAERATLTDAPSEEVIDAMTAGSITFGGVPG